ncbi:trypsin-like peptidase domain-containing protein [Actinocrinis puniceicyclus]|uniref:Trypsin-like peptidase domain-containing protein n=1 Tax=Actinocrinis puniceicyclus TaxID=977794 RepID=A0A8J7WJT7_9ACTN|nr:trypsin-like peptidase domain-containing protein [Actinocrinis puniceicyclus]MBS2963598.1 trypsin-like peptidase domain-containing protein [Actinocrinis puniceicyclus]
MRIRSVVVLILVFGTLAACVSVRQGGGGFGGPGGSSGPGGASGAPGSASFASVQPDLVFVDSTLGEQSEQAAGTGVVLTSSGEVLTNNHVIEGATNVQVTDAGTGHTYTATVAGYDRSRDVALLRLQGARNLPTATLDTSAQPSIGDRVASVGNAGGTGSLAVAPGTITALNQSITASDQSSGSAEQLTGLIQVRAQVRPGDSGGPLVNSAGRVIGITTAAGSTYQFHSRGGTTAGFAIPIGTAPGIGRQIAAGRASQTVHVGPTGQLGLEITGTSAGMDSAGGGAAVAGVLPGEPAQAAGLAEGDVITSLDAAPVDSPTTLIALIDRDRPGQSVEIGWTDGTGRSRTATVTLAVGPAG